MLHLITFSTHHSERMQSCWLQWASHVMARDTTPQQHYRLYLRTHDASNVSTVRPKGRRVTAGGAAGTYQTATWYAALRDKMFAIQEVLEETKASAREVDAYVITDLDVVPLRPYSELLACLEHEITFMKEPDGHAGSFGAHVVNGGFYVVRNTANVRAWFTNVASRFKKYPRLHDQDIANALLLAHIRHPRAAAIGLPYVSRGKPELNWGVFPTSRVTGVVDEVRNETVAYHAIFSTNSSDKMANITRAMRRSGTTLPHCRGGHRGARSPS